MKTIDDILLSHGGNTVLHNDPDYDELLVARGRLLKMNPKNEIVLDGHFESSHKNTSGFYFMHFPFLDIVTGYALCAHGAWSRHSWLMSFEGHEIWETMLPMKWYFGMRLNDEETAHFVMQDVMDCLPGLDIKASWRQADVDVTARSEQLDKETGKVVCSYRRLYQVNY